MHIRKAYRQWRVYGGGPENIHYSALHQIKRENVHQLESRGLTIRAMPSRIGNAVQPIVVNDLLYVTTPKLRVLALNAANGKLYLEFRSE